MTITTLSFQDVLALQTPRPARSKNTPPFMTAVEKTLERFPGQCPWCDCVGQLGVPEYVVTDGRVSKIVTLGCPVKCPSDKLFSRNWGNYILYADQDYDSIASKAVLAMAGEESPTLVRRDVTLGQLSLIESVSALGWSRVGDNASEKNLRKICVEFCPEARQSPREQAELRERDVWAYNKETKRCRKEALASLMAAAIALAPPTVLPLPPPPGEDCEESCVPTMRCCQLGCPGLLSTAVRRFDEDDECTYISDGSAATTGLTPNGRKSMIHGMPFLSGPTKEPSKRLVGLEVEYNAGTRDGLREWLLKWRGAIHTDGSCGWEAVTTPIAGDNVRKCLKDLTSAMKEGRFTADSRCSVHVHVDASDMRWSDIVRLVKVYARIEPLLYVIGGQSRAYNTYSRHCGAAYLDAVNGAFGDKKAQAGRLVGAIFSAHELRRQYQVSKLSDHDLGHMILRTRPGKKHKGRYRGMNLMPWLAGRRTNAPDTTIEFRIHRNCLDGERLAQWAMLLARIVDFASYSSDAEVDAWLDNHKSALRALCAISLMHKPWILARLKAWRKATTATPGTVNEATGDPIPVRGVSVFGGVWKQHQEAR